MKKEARVIGIDDSPFKKEEKGKKVLVVGTIFRGGEFMDGLLSCYIRKDGSDSTNKIIQMINRSKFLPQLQLIFLNGIAVGGFNVIDIDRLNKETGLPVIVVIRHMPNMEKIHDALKKASLYRRKKLIEKAGKIHKAGKLFIQFKGIKPAEAVRAIKICSTRANIPEALRVAHIIASGIVDGESRGGA